MTLASIDARSGNVVSADNNKRKGPEGISGSTTKATAPNPVQAGPAVKVQLDSKSSGASAPRESKASSAADSSDKSGPSNQISTEIDSDSAKLDSVA